MNKMKFERNSSLGIYHTMNLKKLAATQRSPFFCVHLDIKLIDGLFNTITPRSQMGSESIAHEAKGRMGY